MAISCLLVANRGEIAIRIARAAAGLSIRTVAIFAEDDATSLHTRVADEAIALAGSGAQAYLDIDAIIAAAVDAGCDAIHPGYGFLAERADFARACSDAGLTFVGPSAEHLALFGDKARAREAATAAAIPVFPGIDHAVTQAQARAFFATLEPGAAMMIKALAGGGGRGSRVVHDAGDIDATFKRCQSEAVAAFGRDDLYVEAFMPRARHIEVQILADSSGAVTHLYERECSVQRRFQKVIEIAPAPHLDECLRDKIVDAAVTLARHFNYSNIGTFEFLVDASEHSGSMPFAFIETNARLQVEHTVTEAVTGTDIVQAQIRLADGVTLAELGLEDSDRLRPRGFAIQTRVNLETLSADGSVKPGGGTLNIYEPPSGPGVRTDGFGYAGYTTSSLYDSLLAKVITHTPSQQFDDAVASTLRALSEFKLDGVSTNLSFLKNVLSHPALLSGQVHTRWVDEQLATLTEPNEQPLRYVTAAATGSDGFAGARVDSSDPLALFAHDAEIKASQGNTAGDLGAPTLGPDGSIGMVAPIQGTIVAIEVDEGAAVLRGQPLAVVEAMKMEHVIAAESSGTVRQITMAVGDVVREGYPLVFVEAADGDEDGFDASAVTLDLDHIRDDLQESIDRHAYTLDKNREAAVSKRKSFGYRMPRENIDHLVDPGSFEEYWPLIVAFQHQRYDITTLREKYPADGVVAGTASINGDLFDDEASRAIIVHYDYTVLAGTQGRRNHYKQDRMFELAHRFRMPIVLFSEGGGGRPGDDNVGPRVAFDTHTFTTFSQLSGLVPMVGINNGRCFAGNTALLAFCDVIIATESSTIAMGGPAMIEGGGLGIYTPEEVGPMSFQVPNGVVDILVKDEVEAVEVAKKYLSYFQGPIETWEEADDQRKLRHTVPENRVRLYDMREIIRTVADKDSVLEIREQFGIGVITCFIRLEGRPMGVIANNPHHLAGAVDSDGADKGARFLQLCDAFDIPVLSLMDCPGIMVGPDHERTALVRHCTRMFNVGANMTTPLFGVIVRKAYGLGVQAMCGASALVGFFTVAWPTAEFAGMNIEGAVKLGFRPVLAAIEDPDERKAEFDRRVEDAYETARAVNAGTGGGIDDVIDPADTRRWIAHGLRRVPKPPKRTEKKYPYIDTW